jgi:putative exosortase-associated protein (TIGR04073 family)
MKKLLIVLLAVFILLSMVAINYAATPSEKLARGIANVPIGALLEIPKNIDMEWRGSKNAAIGIFCGFFKGLAMGVGRLGSGLWDIFTFPAAVPKGYEPLMKPNLVFDKE